MTTSSIWWTSQTDINKQSKTAENEVFPSESTSDNVLSNNSIKIESEVLNFENLRIK